MRASQMKILLYVTVQCSGKKMHLISEDEYFPFSFSYISWGLKVNP